MVSSFKEKELFWEDIEGYIPPFKNPQDSLFKVQSYVTKWISRQQSLEKAQLDSSIDFNRINRKLERLKEDLIIHEYHSNYVDKHLDKNISEQEIKAYYEKNKNVFTLKEPIIKGLFVKITNRSKNLYKIERYGGKTDSTNQARLKKIVEAEATNYDLDINSWKKLSDYLIRTPFYHSDNEIMKLKRNKTLRKEKDGFVYFIKIFDYLEAKEIAPLETRESTIKHIILNDRKQDLIKRLTNGDL